MNIYEFAEACGVSIGTVSRAINGRKNVDPETRAMILRRMDELGYRPSRTARALSTGRTEVISVWIGMLSSHYGTRVLQHIEEHLGDTGYEMLVRDLKYRRIEEPLPESILADGVIVVDSVPWVEKLRKTPGKSRTPLVNVGIYVDPSVDHVTGNSGAGVTAAMRHLLEVGCRRIAFLSPRPYNTMKEPRYAAYMEVIRGAGLSPEVIPTREDRRSEAVAALSAHIPTHGVPDALMCFNDDHAIAAYRVLRDRGVRVPEDTAIVGFDGIEETEYLERPLTTVSVPLKEMCATAWHFLEQRMANPDLPAQKAVYDLRLEVRATSMRGSTRRGKGRAGSVVPR